MTSENLAPLSAIAYAFVAVIFFAVCSASQTSKGLVMRLRIALSAVIAGAGILVWMTAPMASASTTGRVTTHVSATTSAAGPDISYAHLCNLNGSQTGIYGCAMSHGSLHAVTLVAPSTSSLTNFGYDTSTHQFKQESTDLCLEYNARSATYPVRMDTCVSGRASQEWYEGLTDLQLLNDYSLTCLEGSEVIGFGNPLTMSPCSNYYNGQNWVAYSG